MNYLALARKWRPRDFSQMVGQDHVVTALKHALDNNRVHHAFLLTGTRGIGKTTLARILAKSLNCQTKGVTSSPCNECSHCVAVDEGRFIDLIEVDAASRTKVDDTRDLLDNVQYAPTSGEYKIYLIDEVHMLSGHSFNALLKTLEEPPPHVKFVLATTDPQKLPITVLSRCLQFYLKALSVEQISAQLKLILDAEALAFDDVAVDLLARSAKGSMRDGLSLLDQAIAFGGEKVQIDQVRAMLGLVDDQFVFQVLQALAESDIASLVNISAQMTEKSVDFVGFLDELLSRFHQLSLLHFVPEIDSEVIYDKPQLEQYLPKFDQQTLQLFYQITLLGKRDIHLAPDMAIGMEMILLRLAAFTPNAPTGSSQDSQPASIPSPPPQAKPAGRLSLADSIKSDDRAQPAKQHTQSKSVEPAPVQNVPEKNVSGENVPEPTQTAPDNAQSTDNLNADNWPQFVETLGLTGFAREVVMNALLHDMQADKIELHVSESCSHLVNDKRKSLIEKAFVERLGRKITLALTVENLTSQTPQQIQKAQHQKDLANAEQTMLDDPSIKELMTDLDATMIPGSVKLNQ